MAGSGAAARLAAALGRSRPGLADRARAARRAADVRGDGLRPPVGDQGVREHRRPRPDDRRARPSRPAPPRPAARPRGPDRPAGAVPRPHPAGAATRRRDRGRRGHHRPPRRLDLRADPRGHLDPLLRLVHALAVPDAPRLPAAPEPAAGLRLVPLQQARAAHAGGDRLPQALRAGRLPRLDDRRPAALDRRARLLLGLPDHDDRHGVPRPRRPAGGGRAGRLRRHPRRRGAAGRRHVPPLERRRPAPPVRRERLRGAGAARALPARVPGRRHVAAALLPAGPLTRRRRGLPPQEPLGRPLRRADRHRRRRVRRHPRRPARQARAGVRRDPRRPRRGGGLRAVARDQRRRRGGGRAAPPRGEPAGAGRPGDHREDGGDRGRGGLPRPSGRRRRRRRRDRAREGRAGQRVGADRVAARAHLAAAAPVGARARRHRRPRRAARPAVPGPVVHLDPDARDSAAASARRPASARIPSA